MQRSADRWELEKVLFLHREFTLCSPDGWLCNRAEPRLSKPGIDWFSHESRVMIQARLGRERSIRDFAHRAVGLGLARTGFTHLCSRLLRARLCPSANRFGLLTPDIYGMDRERPSYSFHSVAASTFLSTAEKAFTAKIGNLKPLRPAVKSGIRGHVAQI